MLTLLGKNLIFDCFSIPIGEEAPIPKGGVKPTFTERPVIRQSEEESNKIIFECRLVGEPRPDITWYHNEKQIVETDRHKYSMELDAKLYYLCRLEIANVDARDMGTYKAVARNASGEGHATINLTFEEGMKIGTKNEGIVMCKNNRYLLQCNGCEI